MDNHPEDGNRKWIAIGGFGANYVQPRLGAFADSNTIGYGDAVGMGAYQKGSSPYCHRHAE